MFTLICLILALIHNGAAELMSCRKRVNIRRMLNEVWLVDAGIVLGFILITLI
jgi:hypothetical protein